jgi:enoyl-CoA hydratase/carnithine racemase
VDEGPVLLEKEGAVAIVRLNRAEKHNAINRAMSTALAGAMEELESDDAVRVIILTGSGEKAFCAGADMSEGVDQMDGRGQGHGAGEGINAVARATKPTIAAINGYAYRGGALLAISTDIRLASPEAKIRFVGASYGLVVGGSQLPRIIGPAHAKELLFTTRVVDAAEAERIGLVNRVVPSESLLEHATKMALEIAAASPYAVAWSKKVVDAATEVDQGRAAEAEANRALRSGADHASRFRDAAGRIVSRG